MRMWHILKTRYEDQGREIPKPVGFDGWEERTFEKEGGKC